MAARTFSIGPPSGRLILHTGRAGVGGRLGHDLVLEVTAWDATVEVDPDAPSSARVHVRVDARSFEVREATGGVKPLTASDRDEIRRNIAKLVPPAITFASTDVVVAGDRVSVEGELTVGRTTRSTRLDGTVTSGAEETTIAARTTIVQSAFDIKPYSAMMGALKVRDEVEVHVRVTLPSAS